MRFPLEKLGTADAVTIVVACTICFPKLALVGAALGLGAFASIEIESELLGIAGGASGCSSSIAGAHGALSHPRCLSKG